MRVKVPYISAWFTVILPTAEFLVLWIGLSLLIIWRLGWNVSDLLGCAIWGGNVVVALAACVATYPLLMRIASSLSTRMGGELLLEGDHLRWHRGSRRGEIDFARPHHAKLEADRSYALVSINHGEVEVHLAGFPREQVLEVFPDPCFVGTLPISPAMGSWGYTLSMENPDHAPFFRALLETLWRNRTQNRRFLLYQKFPWDRPPQPAFRHVRLISPAEWTPEEETFIRQLEAETITRLDPVIVTPDYLVAWVYRTVRSHWTGQPDFYCVMPLGRITAEVSLPRPDWKPFIVGHVLLEAMAQLGSGSRPYGPPLQERRYLYVRGRGKDGKELEMAFDWYNPTDREWEEAEMVVEFVNRGRRA